MDFMDQLEGLFTYVSCKIKITDIFSIMELTYEYD